MQYKTDDEHIRSTRNASRFFVEHREIAWTVLIFVIIGGIFAYLRMPQRKDPEITVRVAVAVCRYPGATAQQVEQLVTRPIEDVIAQNKSVHAPSASDVGIRSLSLPGASFVYVQLSDGIKDTSGQFNDIGLKLADLSKRLPDGAGPVQFDSDFGDTAALMLTVASPPADDVEVNLRAQSIVDALQAEQAEDNSRAGRVSIVVAYPLSLSGASARQMAENFRHFAQSQNLLSSAKVVGGAGFIALQGESNATDSQIESFLHNYLTTHIQESDIPPDVWPPFVVRDLRQVRDKLKTVAGAKYTYADLDNYTDLISRTLLRVPQTSRVDRRGVLAQAVYLDYSQQKLAASGFQPAKLRSILGARNITLPAGAIQAGPTNVILDPSGQFEGAQEIGDVIVSRSSTGDPVYLRDLVEISQGYQSPPQYLNYYTWQDQRGQWHRSRAITLAIYMRPGEQIEQFGRNIDQQLEDLRPLMPRDLVIAHSSDQPLQVKESIDLFMDALYEAIVLVVIVALVGFWEWRSAVVMALSIPITLAMTFGIAFIVHIDLQQVSIATIIIALGLLVDDPVVANDAIKRDLASGRSPLQASWLGPTKLAHAIVYATATNIIAYLPFLLVRGTTGEFLYSLPIVMTAALVASRITSMTFVPLLGYYLLRPGKNPEMESSASQHGGFYDAYKRAISFATERRKMVCAGSLVFLVIGVGAAITLKSQFFPDDVQYWSYVDIWLPNNTPVSVTNNTALRTEAIIRRVVASYERNHSRSFGRENRHASESLLRGLSSFVGGGGPRFWFSVSPEQQQPNYAQIIIQLRDKQATPELVRDLQEVLNAEVAGAHLIVHQLQTNPVEVPVQLRVFGLSDADAADEAQANDTLRLIARRSEAIFRTTPGVAVVQDNWFAEGSEVRLRVDADRANMAGITNSDVANSAMAGISGFPVTTLRAGNREIPVIARLHPDERASLSDVEHLYVYSSSGEQKVPLLSVASIQNTLETQRIVRQEHFRMISVDCYPQPGVLASEVLRDALPRLKELERTLPPGFHVQLSGEDAKRKEGFADLAVVLLTSLLGIYFTLLLQFSSPIKPLLVLAATPYGVVGALIFLAVSKTPFGFMAFFGIVSLIGVIVSHVIVLFDCIEEMRERGEPLDDALRTAGLTRLRPVLITVGATVLALFPLAWHGGPLWQPLCYAQIGGLLVATFVTLLLVPALYSFFVRDLRIIEWRAPSLASDDQEVLGKHVVQGGSR